MVAIDAKQITLPDGQVKEFGCGMHNANCPITNWLYKGFSIPPCCQRTLKKLLFYTDDLFREYGMRYMLTDGALLGSLKFGGLLQWDSDIDLHIRTEDFHRIGPELKERVEKDGYFLRAHAGGRSWLLQPNEDNYLMIEWNLRDDRFDDSWKVPIDNRLFPAMRNVMVNASDWYGVDFLQHKIRHVFVGRAEDADLAMKCATPGHPSCLHSYPPGANCRFVGTC